MIRAVLLLLALATPAAGQETARDASVRLLSAVQGLEQAQSADARIAALTEAVEAYDQGLAALREGLRQISGRQGALEADLIAREEQLSRLVGVLTGIEGTPRPLLFMHPEGPAGAARAAMLLGDAAPALEAQAALLRGDLDRLAQLRALEEQAAASLEEGLDQVQSTREALSIAIADRTDLPPRFASGGAALTDMRQRATTLASFAESLIDLPGPPNPSANRSLPLPVRGTVLRSFNQADAAGAVRPGIILETSPQAPVRAPTRAIVRYVGPLLDYGVVIVLEPAPGALLTLAGLDQAYVDRADIIAPGTLLGLMGDIAPQAQQNVPQEGQGGGAFATDTLYIEVRQQGAPVDPALWFDLTQAQPSTDE